MTYRLFIDDLRDAPDPTWVVARTVEEAIEVVTRKGLPDLMSLDHDLGIDPNTGKIREVPEFLKWLCDNYYEEGPPDWRIHSANPKGIENMTSYLKSWSKSLLI